MFKKTVLFISIITTLAIPTVAKERKIYNKNQGLHGVIDLTMLYGTWVSAIQPKKHKGEIVIITPANLSYLEKAIELFKEKDKAYRAEVGGSWNPYSSLLSSYKDHLRNSNRLMKLRIKIDAISAVPLKKRHYYQAIDKALREASESNYENIYSGSVLAFFKYKNGVLSGGNVTISSDYIAHESLPNRKSKVNYRDAIKINKDKYNFDVIGETDLSMLLDNGSNYHFYDIIDENKFIVYKGDGSILHAYKRVKTSYEFPFHSKYSPMLEAIGLNKIKNKA